MKFKTATAFSTAIASVFLAHTFALADSESGGLEGASYSSMTGSISNAGGGNQSGGVLTTGSVSETGGPRETPTNSQSGGALMSRGVNQSGGPTSATESGISPQWLPLGWGSTLPNNAAASAPAAAVSASVTASAADATDASEKKVAGAPNMVVRNYRWQSRKSVQTSNTKFAYRARTAM